MSALQNQVVLITGCSSGIGRALAEEFRRQGHRVIATARRPESIDELREAGFETTRVDVTDETSIRAAVDFAVETAGRVDIVVNNAGYGLIAPTIEISSEDVRHQLETNVVGPLALARAVAPQMVERGSGRIVNMGSVSGILVSPFAGAYCASKAALHVFSDALRMELAPFGIDVILVQPGAIRSGFGSAAEGFAKRYGGEGSWYAPIKDGLIKRAQSSQKDAMDTGEFAREVVAAVTAEKAPPVLRLGSGAAKFVAMQKWLPTSVLDKVLAKMFSLNDLKRPS
ncbi:MAG: SDR family NAD(P)-dependent oxidoreductase [Candidatus Lernaella stagnicola]|nr:SDR family NAD(P)-dependent oxidoreductase [Candidatus Lernaella stagnicola]